MTVDLREIVMIGEKIVKSQESFLCFNFEKSPFVSFVRSALRKILKEILWWIDYQKTSWIVHLDKWKPKRLRLL